MRAKAAEPLHGMVALSITTLLPAATSARAKRAYVLAFVPVAYPRLDATGLRQPQFDDYRHRDGRAFCRLPGGAIRS